MPAVRANWAKRRSETTKGGDGHASLSTVSNTVSSKVSSKVSSTVFGTVFSKEVEKRRAAGEENF